VGEGGGLDFFVVLAMGYRVGKIWGVRGDHGA
jgi:hypothetical protein